MTVTVSIRKTIAVFLIACMSIFAFACVINVDSVQAASKSAVSKMAKKSKNGLKKYKGKWYLIKNKKVVKGLKKIKDNYYFFDKKGVMQSGAKKIKGKNYYFQKVRSGKQKGQAPALAGQALTKNGNAYYYDEKGVRYGFKFKSTGNNIYGDAAAGKVLSEAKITATGTKQARLEKAYRFILKKYSYMNRPTPKMSSGWKYKCAYDMAFGMDRMGKQKAGLYQGKCYNYAALTGLVAEALGYSADVQVSTCRKPGAKEPTEHAWVTFDENSKTKILDSMWDHNAHKDGTGKLEFFCEAINIAKDGSFTLNGYSYF